MPRDSRALANARADLKAQAEPAKAIGQAVFFKTAAGEYAEGDVFLGVTTPALRTLARAYEGLSLRDLDVLLRSRFHEERSLALFILVRKYERGDAEARRACFDFYLGHLAYVNNWDLVDLSAAPVVGAYVLATYDRRTLPRLAKSKVLWERRVAMVASFAFIRAGDAKTPFAIAESLLKDRHDLIHKAVGWMLREVGKRIGEDTLRGFLEVHAGAMPRTSLRYAIERFAPAERARWLAVPRRA
jgi:3-methyladenine DNA glycosylase AlkD